MWPYRFTTIRIQLLFIIDIWIVLGITVNVNELKRTNGRHVTNGNVVVIFDLSYLFELFMILW